MENNHSFKYYYISGFVILVAVIMVTLIWASQTEEMGVLVPLWFGGSLVSLLVVYFIIVGLAHLSYRRKRRSLIALVVFLTLIILSVIGYNTYGDFRLKEENKRSEDRYMIRNDFSNVQEIKINTMVTVPIFEDDFGLFKYKFQVLNDGILKVNYNYDVSDCHCYSYIYNSKGQDITEELHSSGNNVVFLEGLKKDDIYYIVIDRTRTLNQIKKFNKKYPDLNTQHSRFDFLIQVIDKLPDEWKKEKSSLH